MNSNMKFTYIEPLDTSSWYINAYPVRYDQNTDQSYYNVKVELHTSKINEYYNISTYGLSLSPGDVLNQSKTIYSNVPEYVALSTSINIKIINAQGENQYAYLHA